MTLFHQHDIFKHLLVYCSKVSPQPEKINVESKCWAAGQMCCIIHHLCFQSLLLVCLFCNAKADIIYLYCCSSMYVPRESYPWPWRSECQLSWMSMTWICFQKGDLFYLIQLFSNPKAKNYTHFCEFSGMPTVCVSLPYSTLQWCHELFQEVSMTQRSNGPSPLTSCELSVWELQKQLRCLYADSPSPPFYKLSLMTAMPFLHSPT